MQDSCPGIVSRLGVLKSLSCELVLPIQSPNCFTGHWAPANILVLCSTISISLHLEEFLISVYSDFCRSHAPPPHLSFFKTVGPTFWTGCGHSKVVCPFSPCASCGLYPCLASLVPLTCVTQSVYGQKPLLAPVALSIGMINNNECSYYWLESKLSLHHIFP